MQKYALLELFPLGILAKLRTKILGTFALF